MPRPEFLAWIEFYKQQPFDDYHRHYRPAALIGHSMSGADLDDLLGWLERRPAPNLNTSELQMMKALGMKPPKA